MTTLSDRLYATWGTTVALNVTVTIASLPDDLEGADLVWMVKRSVGDADADALIDKRLSTGGIVPIDLAAGTVQLQLDPVDYADFPPERETTCPWGLYVVTAGDRYQAAAGLFVCMTAVWRGGPA